MKLEKISAADEVFARPMPELGAPVCVQGGKKRASGNILLVESGGRYKLFCEGCDRLKILEGSGHFKWARGELAFTAGEAFRAEKIGEYELNGRCIFLAVRE